MAHENFQERGMYQLTVHMHEPNELCMPEPTKNVFTEMHNCTNPTCKWCLSETDFRGLPGCED
jgi:hypothetical protein